MHAIANIFFEVDKVLLLEVARWYGWISAKKFFVMSARVRVTELLLAYLVGTCTYTFVL